MPLDASILFRLTTLSCPFDAERLVDPPDSQPQRRDDRQLQIHVNSRHPKDLPWCFSAADVGLEPSAGWEQLVSIFPAVLPSQ